LYPDTPEQQRGQPRTGAVGSSVLLVGVGALGCPAATVLAGAQLGRLTLVDPDRVERSNLQRQTLFSPGDIGRLKVDVAAERLGGGTTEIVPVVARVDRTNAARLMSAHDFVIDACDDPATKFLINATAVRCGVPYSYGGVVRTSGLTMTVVPGVTACLACVFAAESLDAQEATGEGCQNQGVLAPVAGVIGSLQAAHALATLGSETPEHAGRLFSYELRARRWRTIDVHRDSRCNACGAERHEAHARRNDPCLS
jgi:molybdopterin/thiamine biosynthesis adenylyltransferase